MQEHGQSFVFTMTFAVFAIVMLLVWRRRITERFAIVWVVISLVLLAASSIGFRHLFKLAQLVGVPYPPSALFLLAMFGLTLLVIQLFACVSKLNERTRVLVQQVALLRDQVDRHARPGATRDRAAGGS